LGSVAAASATRRQAAAAAADHWRRSSGGGAAAEQRRRSSGGGAAAEQRRRSSGGGAAAAEQRRRSIGGGAAAAEHRRRSSGGGAAAAHPLFAGLGEHHPALCPPHLRCISISFAAPTPLSTLTPFRAPRASVATVSLSQALCCASVASRSFSRASHFCCRSLFSRLPCLCCRSLSFATKTPLLPLARFCAPRASVAFGSLRALPPRASFADRSQAPTPLLPVALFRAPPRLCRLSLSFEAPAARLCRRSPFSASPAPLCRLSLSFAPTPRVFVASRSQRRRQRRQCRHRGARQRRQ